ncbi:hypothetical protein EVAR_81877_1 [Eumeta japonica]|uniref:Uncharacterized protein n=1 Tax=Eumeta variegata TaxID=151549 RepID=A0A4C1UXG9_EUMVA|nr:hypothetical protein EVAR_81877_1 [Eumeta japonica]
MTRPRRAARLPLHHRARRMRRYNNGRRGRHGVDCVGAFSTSSTLNTFTADVQTSYNTQPHAHRSGRETPRARDVAEFRARPTTGSAIPNSMAISGNLSHEPSTDLSLVTRNWTSSPISDRLTDSLIDAR